MNIDSPIGVGSRSIRIALGIYFLDFNSLKITLDVHLSESSTKPSGLTPCSRQYNSQQALAT